MSLGNETHADSLCLAAAANTRLVQRSIEEVREGTAIEPERVADQIVHYRARTAVRLAREAERLYERAGYTLPRKFAEIEIRRSLRLFA